MNNITITNEDNMELMARYPDKYFDLAIVDPPYRDENQPTKDMRANGSMKSLEGRPPKEYWQELYRVYKKKTISENFTMSMCEIASLSENLGTVSKWIEISPQDPNRIHPTQKPVKLYEWLLMNYAKEADKILDTHLGSGSIAIACHNLGFDLTACELDKDYFNSAIKRIKQHQQQLTMF
jgi:site-specific DNA-methyltransferase (adenine-specific)